MVPLLGSLDTRMVDPLEIPKLFSKRDAAVSDTLRYDVQEHVRLRILHLFRQSLDSMANRHFSFGDVLDKVGEKILIEYGKYHGSTGTNPFGGNKHPAVKHAIACPDDLFLDFIELCFRVWPYHLAQISVDPVNRILREERIGYELTAFRERDTVEGFHYELPTFIRKENEFLHQEVMLPCLDALSRPGLETARAEMMKAHEAYRRSEYADAITDAGACFESVMKTICKRKNWDFNQDKDSCKKLIDICQVNGLFPEFYAPMFIGVGTIRNKLSDAHGRGPSPQHAVGKEQADHMLRLASTNITFLADLAGL